MKATFISGMALLSGKFGDVVYCRERLTGKVYVRRRVYPEISAHHHRQGSISKQVFALAPSSGYKDDMRIYLSRYNSLRENLLKPARAWSTLFMTLMFRLAERYPEVDLLTITRDYIYDHDLPCISVKRAVAAGLLPEVYDWEYFDREM